MKRRPKGSSVLGALRRSRPRGNLPEERRQVPHQAADGRVPEGRAQREAAHRRQLHRGRDGRAEEVLPRGGRPHLHGRAAPAVEGGRQ